MYIHRILPDYKNTDWNEVISKDRERYIKILDMVTLDDRLCFVSYDRDKDYGEKFTFDQAKTGNWQKAPWKGAALSFIVEENTLDGINEGVNLLMPYYRHILDKENKSKESEAPLTSRTTSKPVVRSGSKTQQLQVLFADWQEAQKNEPDSSWRITNGGNTNITKVHFQIDGIIDEEVFSDEKRKILFISNEANGNEYGAKDIDHKRYFVLSGKQVPIIRMWHTAYFQSKIESPPGYSNKTVGKLCAKLVEEMARFGL